MHVLAKQSHEYYLINHYPTFTIGKLFPEGLLEYANSYDRWIKTENEGKGKHVG